ncbi:hypothetical protein [Thiomonas bhubaneswarensis]|uniref:Uncharacterized protein n=1 Tax=Thiomonas bhubaneswarensis TaxID=339866 RepID=A0A0K6I122_9BURK|nr:hypothetical protein [Thiomonas bhubaneswarensis]CUA96992.1 hypothetical protein Ga0061069_10551 [Thiomonas bhubaneswarensis]
MFYRPFKVDYSLVGERDGSAGRAPDPALWRRDAYRRGYAQGLLARAERIAQGAAPMPMLGRSSVEARL